MGIILLKWQTKLIYCPPNENHWINPEDIKSVLLHKWWDQAALPYYDIIPEISILGSTNLFGL